MTVRYMTLEDLPKVMDYMVEQTWQDNFHKWFFPGKHEYPFHYRRWWTAYVRNLILRPNVYCYAIEEEKTGRLLGWVEMHPTNKNDQPVDLDLSKNSRRERWLRRYWSHHDALLERVRPNRAANQARFEYFFKVVSPWLKKTLYVGEDSRNWTISELVLDPSMQPQQSKDICIQLLDHAREQCLKDNVAFWAFVEEQFVNELEEYGFKIREPIVIGNVTAYAMRFEEAE